MLSFGIHGECFCDVHADVALLEQHRSIVAAQKRVAQSRLQTIPTGSQRAGDIADILVVHEQQRAQAVRLHPLARALQPVFTQPVPIYALLPIQAHRTDVCQDGSSSKKNMKSYPARVGASKTSTSMILTHVLIRQVDSSEASPALTGQLIVADEAFSDTN